MEVAEPFLLWLGNDATPLLQQTLQCTALVYIFRTLQDVLVYWESA